MTRDNEIYVRRFSPSDMRRVIEIERTSFAIDAFSEIIFMSWYNKCPELFILAKASGMTVGYMSTCVLNGKGDVVSIAVDPSYRRRGAGKTLADYTIKELESSTAEVVELEVRTSNIEGIRFWEDLGFFPIGTVPYFYRDGAEALQMRKLLGNNR